MAKKLAEELGLSDEDLQKHAEQFTQHHFFERLAEHGIVPKTAEEADKLVKIAAVVVQDAVAKEHQIKTASSQRVSTAIDMIYEKALGKSAASADKQAQLVKRAKDMAAAYMSSPEAVLGGLAILENEVE